MPEKRGVTSPFTDYVKFLPLELLPTFWTDDERALLTGTTLAPAISAKTKALYREFDSLRAATSTIPWCNGLWWDEIDGHLSFDDWLQVDAMYRSRALEFPGIGDCMVPCIDMANHSSGDLTGAIYEVNGQGDAVLLLRDNKTVRSGDEISITYGDAKGACEMIFSYGFLEDSMSSARELFLDLSIPDDDPLRKAKEAIADSAPGFKILDAGAEIEWHSEYVWLICINEEDGLDFAVEQDVEGNHKLRAFWKDDGLPEPDKIRSILEKDRFWPLYHLRAVSILQARIAEQLQSLYGSDDRVNNTEHGNATNVRDRPWTLCVQLRALEAELLEKAYSFFENQKNELADSPTVQEYLQSMNSHTGDSAEDDFS